jgi:hypothetical protein
MNSLMYLLHNILADFMHELVALIHDEGFIADNDRAIFMGLGRPAADEDLALSLTMRATILQEHGWRSVREGIINEVRHSLRFIGRVGLRVGSLVERTLRRRMRAFDSHMVLEMRCET